MNSPEKRSAQNLREQVLQSWLKSLQQQVACLQDYIQADINAKSQLEADLRDEEALHRRANLNQAIEESRANFCRHEEELERLRKELGQIFQNHIDEEIYEKDKLSNTLRNETEPNHRDEINQAIEQIVEHLQQHEEERDDLRKRIDFLKEKIESQVQPTSHVLVEQPRQNVNFLEENSIRYFPKAKFLIASVIAILASLAVPSLWYKDVSARCNQTLEPLQQDADIISNAQKILDACKTVVTIQSSNVDAWKKAGWASLVRWSSDLPYAEKTKIADETKSYFTNAVVKSNSEDPQALFYQSFMKDFEEFALKQKFSCEESVRTRYGQALNIYKRDGYQVSDGDYFVLLELSHFLMHRDVNHEEAIELLKNVLQGSGLQSKQLRKGILLSQAKAETYLNRFSQAKDSLEEALRYDEQSYKIMQDLASAYAQIAIDESTEEGLRDKSREKAIDYYKKVIQEGVASNVYRAWRNLSLLLYLHRDYPGAVQTFNKTLSFDKAINEYDKANKSFIQKYQKLAEICSKKQGCSTDRLTLLKELKSRHIFADYFITHDFVESELKDPFFEIEHDKFYKCRK